jgi:hypothetical protein
MALLAYLAIDFAALHQAIWHGSDRALMALMVLTTLVPIFAGLLFLIRRIDTSGRTLY